MPAKEHGIDQTSPPAMPLNTSMAARYGQLILNNGVAAIPQTLFYKQAQCGLLAQEVWFISAVLARKWSGDLPHPDLEVMARESGITSRQLRRYRANLEAKGYLQVKNRYDETGRQLSCAYDFSGLFETLERLLAAETATENEIRSDEVFVAGDNENREYSFVARYGRVIAAAGIASIPQALFTYQSDLGLTAAQSWFCCYILAHRWSTELPYPSLRKMSERTGYSQQHLHDLKNSIVELGYLSIVGRLDENGRQDSNAYDFGQLFAALVRRIEQTTPPINQPAARAALVPMPKVAKRGQHGAAGRVNPGGHSVDSLGGRTVEIDGGHPVDSPGGRTVEREAEHLVEIGGGHPVDSPGGHLVDRRQTSSLETRRTAGLETRRTASLDEEEAKEKEAEKEDSDSNQRHARKKAGAEKSPLPYSPWIAAVIVDYSRELGDVANVQSNTTQAMRIRQNSGVPEALFVDLLHQAKALTREYQSKQGWGSINNRMAYFFRVLTDIIEKHNVTRP